VLEFLVDAGIYFVAMAWAVIKCLLIGGMIIIPPFFLWHVLECRKERGRN
jgi:hypothetical protein